MASLEFLLGPLTTLYLKDCQMNGDYILRADRASYSVKCQALTLYQFAVRKQ
jgi:hypothetical protein